MFRLIPPWPEQVPFPEEFDQVPSLHCVVWPEHEHWVNDIDENKIIVINDAISVYCKNKR
ncbi:MAG: hypothetical protein SPLM_00360 [Spiroplasma phoeniceum]